MKRDLPSEAAKQFERDIGRSGRTPSKAFMRGTQALSKSASPCEPIRSPLGRFFLALTPYCRRSDEEILLSANDTLLSITEVPTDYVEVRVTNGWIALSGEVDWGWQRELVLLAMRRVVGAAGVGDGIEVRSATPIETTTAPRLVAP